MTNNSAATLLFYVYQEGGSEWVCTVDIKVEDFMWLCADENTVLMYKYDGYTPRLKGRSYIWNPQQEHLIKINLMDVNMSNRSISFKGFRVPGIDQVAQMWNKNVLPFEAKGFNLVGTHIPPDEFASSEEAWEWLNKRST